MCGKEAMRRAQCQRERQVCAQAEKLSCEKLEDLDVPLFLVSPTGKYPVVLCSHTFANMLGRLPLQRLE